MILGNIDQLAFNGYRKLGHFSVQSNYKPSTWYLAYFPDTITTSVFKGACFPTGTQPPYSWLLAPKGGELSSTTQITGTGTLSSSLTLGRVMTANLAGIGDIAGSLSLITSLAASLSGSGTLSGNLSLTLGLAANLAGSGDLSGALSLLMELVADLSGSGTLAGNLKGNADLHAIIYVNQSEATVQQLVTGVWSALAADFNVAGTMGNKLNGAGSAGDPWTTDLSPYTTPGTAGKKLKDLKNPSLLIGGEIIV